MSADIEAAPICIEEPKPRAGANVYRAIVRKKFRFLFVAGIALAGLFLLDLATGPSRLSLPDLVSALLHPAECPARLKVVVWTLRLPVALMAVCVGASLGLAGAQMQTILNNGLASPYTLGVSSAASFGAALAIVTGWNPLSLGPEWLVPLSAFAFAVLSSVAILGLAKFRKGNAHTLVLAGIAIGFLFNALLSFLQFTAKENQLSAIVFWIFGSLQGVTWARVALVAGTFAIVLPLLLAESWALTALRLGDPKATSMGVNVGRLRIRIAILTALLTAISVCFTGSIGFIGLVAPHFARYFVGDDQRFYSIASAILGAILLAFASIVSKALIPGAVVPIGIATTFIGIPFLIGILVKRKAL